MKKCFDIQTRPAVSSEYPNIFSSSSDKTVIKMITSLIIALLLCIVKFKWRRPAQHWQGSILAPVLRSIRARGHWPWNFRKQQKKVHCISLCCKSIESTNPFIFESNTFLEQTITIFSKMRHFCIPYVIYWVADDTRQQGGTRGHSNGLSSCEHTISGICSYLGDFERPGMRFMNVSCR